MDVKKIIDEIKRKYPGKTIVLDSKDTPKEIICEIDPSSDHPESSVALVVVGKSKSHYHIKSTEIYETVKGVLTVFINGHKFILREGEKITIKPKEVHTVESDESWFLAYSKPGWRSDDHIVVR